MWKMILHRRTTVIFALFALLSLVGTTFAQGGTISYGQAVVGELTATSPLGVYSFQGTGGDVVNAQAIEIAPGLNLTLNLLSPSGTSVASSDSDPLSPFSSDVRLSFRLPSSGIYTLLIGAGSGNTGQYLLRLDGAPSPETQPLSPTDANQVAVNGAPVIFTVDANPDVTTLVNVSTDGLMVTIEVRDSNGQIVNIVVGVSDTTLSIPAGTGMYEIIVRPSPADAQGNITITLGGTGAPPPPPAVTPEVDAGGNEPPPPPATTPEVVVDGAPQDICTVTPPGGNPVNVRPDPSTNNPAIAQLLPGQYFPVVGVNGNWYAISLPGGGQGWVRNDVIVVNGPCANLPTIAATGAINGTGATATFTPTPTPQGQPTLTYTPTTAGNQIQPSATFTPSYTPTAAANQIQPTATYTPSYTPTVPAAQTAPEDARFNNPLDIALDSTASVLDFVSYPNGDREDRVRYSVTGMNANSSVSGGRARLVIAASCFGNGTENVTFFTGGQTYTCGQTIVDKEVTFDSSTGSVVITATGGQGTYVQWVLTGTATRVN